MTFLGDLPFLVVTATSDGTSASSATLSTFAQGVQHRLQNSSGKVRDYRHAGDNQGVLIIEQWMKFTSSVAST
jgi:hypothetical protein